MKPKIVRFNDGTYGIRRNKIFGHEFRDMKSNFWWSQELKLKFYKDCSGEFSAVKKYYDILIDEGVIISCEKQS